MSKSTLRKKYQELRSSLSKKEKERVSRRIHDLLFSRLMMHRYDRIHCYLPKASTAEVDTTLIINTLIKDFGPSLFAPKMVSKNQMTHHPFTSLNEFTENKFGILEPSGEEGLSHEDFFSTDDDILIITPLLAFDKKGYRIGYGGGFYDRFLAHKTKNTTIVGLSFFEATEELLPSDEYDVPLDHCVTGERVWSF